MAIVGLAPGTSGTKRIRGQEQLYKGIGILKARKLCSIISLALNRIALIAATISGAIIGLTAFSL